MSPHQTLAFPRASNDPHEECWGGPANTDKGEKKMLDEKNMARLSTR
jgi:hypothetical protein